MADPLALVESVVGGREAETNLQTREEGLIHK
jgi:hypothetical protein